MTKAQPSYTSVSPDDHAWLGRAPIPAAPYYDPAWFALEREAIFKRTWLQLGHICEIPAPGDFIVRTVDIAGASILIGRDKAGQIHAHHNVCTHRGTQLVDVPSGHRATFTCPYHSWTFAPDGRLLSAPDFDQFHVSKDDCALKKVAVAVCGGLIWVNLDPDPAEGLRDFLGPIADQLERLMVRHATHFTEYEYEIAANWKMNYDNFQENYHLRFVHPRTGAAAIGPENPFGYPSDYAFFGPHRTQTLWKNPDMAPPPAVQTLASGKAVASSAKEDTACTTPPARGKVDFKIFPNQFIVGQAIYFFTHVVMPITPERTRGIIRHYWVGDDESASQRFAREYMSGMLRDVHSEDRGVIIAGAKGLSSGALSHINFQTHEVLCRHLITEVMARVEAYQA